MNTIQSAAETNALAIQTGDLPDAVDERAGLSYAKFVDEYLRPNQPVIVTDAISHWTALEEWTPECFKRRYGSMNIETDGLTMDEFITLIEKSADQSSEALPYLRNKSINQYFPELAKDISPLPIYLEPNWFNNPLVPKRISQHRTDLFIGGRGSKFPYLHFDNYHGFAFIFQIYGEKEFVLIPPEQTLFVYPRDTGKGIENVSNVADIENPDLEQFPLFANASALHCVLGRGEMLFIPAGWWHTARMQQTSISVSSNTANAYNWPGLMSDHWRLFKYKPLKAIAGVPYLTAIWVWESLRDHLYRNRKLYGQGVRN